MYLSHFAAGSLRHHHRVLRRAFDRRDDLVEGELDRGLRFGIEMHLLRLVVGIARLLVPVLAFAFVRRQPHGFAGGEMELLIHIEDGLDVVIARIEIGKRTARIAEGLRVHHQRAAGRQVLDIHAEALCGR